MNSVLKELERAWKKISKHTVWQTLFSSLLSFSNGDNIGDDPHTPPARPAAPPAENTPPDKPAVPARVQNCQPASFGIAQPADKSAIQRPKPVDKAARSGELQAEGNIIFEKPQPEAQRSTRSGQEGKRTSDETAAAESADSDEMIHGKPGRKKTTYKRRRKQPQPSESAVKMLTIKKLTSKLGATWPLFQKIHSRRVLKTTQCNPLKGVSTCASGSLNGLMLILVSNKGKDPDIVDKLECMACQEMLQIVGYKKSHASIQHSLQQAVDERRVPHDLPAGASDMDQDEPAVSAASGGAKNQEDETGMPEQDDQVDEDPFRYAKSKAPMITLLQPGFASKTFPYRCNVCKSRRQPGAAASWPWQRVSGRIGDLCEAKHERVEYYLNKHLFSTSHLARVQSLGDAERQENFVDCEGIQVSSNGGRLSLCKREFMVWAQLANLQDTRPGNCVLFQVPSAYAAIEVGMIVSVWRGVRKPRLAVSEVPIDGVSAFRVLQLLPAEKESAEPEGQNYDLEVKLSQASAEAIPLAAELETWTVEPTMVRGQKRKAGNTSQATSFKQRVARKQAKKRKVAPTEKPGPTAADLEPQPLVLSRDDFKRTQSGRAKIKECMSAIHELDYRQNPSSRMFDGSGVCRLRHCPRITLTECVELAPACLDIMSLD
eukprot:Skav212719  [mRNA]  locus=scaffold113:730213:738201:- [translate_table: standard]